MNTDNTIVGFRRHFKAYSEHEVVNYIKIPQIVYIRPSDVCSIEEFTLGHEAGAYTSSTDKCEIMLRCGMCYTVDGTLYETSKRLGLALDNFGLTQEDMDKAKNNSK